MKRWIPKVMGIVLGLALGWGAADWFTNASPTAARSILAADHVEATAQSEPAKTAVEGGASEYPTGFHRRPLSHEDTIDPAQRNAWNLVPKNTDIRFMPYVLFGMGGLFLTALIVGPFVKKPAEPAADAHGHGDGGHAH